MAELLITHSKVTGDSITEYFEFIKNKSNGTLGRIKIWDSITVYRKNDMVKLKTDGVDVYISLTDSNYNHHPEESKTHWRLTDIFNQQFGENAQKRFRGAVDNFANMFLSVYAFEKDLFAYKNPKGGKSHYYPSFCTLTVPVPCKSDLENKKMFDRWLDNCKKTHGVKCFIWRAEAQLRGAIHFHIAFDRYMDRKAIYKNWYNLLKESGQLNKKLNFEQHSHICHIQSVPDLDCLKFELSGYFSAEELKNESGESVKDDDGNKLYKYKHDRNKTVRQINGRGWGYSDSLKYQPLLLQYMNPDNDYLVYDSSPLKIKKIETKDGFHMGTSLIYKQIDRDKITKKRIPIKSKMNADLGKLMVLYHYLNACKIYGCDTINVNAWNYCMENQWAGVRIPLSMCRKILVPVDIAGTVVYKEKHIPFTFEEFKSECLTKKILND